MKRIIKKYWADQGSCGSCGWHAGLEEYDGYGIDLDDWNNDKKRFELPCLNSDVDSSNHRGVRIYPNKGDIKRIEKTIKQRKEEL